MNCNFLLNYGTDILKNNLIANPLLDSEILLANVLGISREALLLNLEKKINKDEFDKFNLIIDKRKKKEPIAYILEKKEFWKTEFFIDNSVLIPRPDTELVVEEATRCLSVRKSINVLDIGTGSGCIIISLLKERKKWLGIGIDLSIKAIKVAKINAKIQQLENRIKFVHSDIDKFFGYKYDLIISNPPYISRLNLNSLDEDIKDFEPRMALEGGSDGLSEIKKVINRSLKLLKVKGVLILEIGSSQLYKSSEILRKNGFYIKKISKDLAGKNRCITSIKI